MPLARVTISVEAMIFVAPLTESEKAGLDANQQRRLLENRIEKIATESRSEIIREEPDVVVDIEDFVNRVEDLRSEFVSSLPWPSSKDERNCFQILQDEAT